MDPMLEEWIAAARRLLTLRAVLWLTILATYGFALGWMLRHSASTTNLDALVFLGAFMIGGAAFHMTSAEKRLQRQRKKKLDALYGRRSSP